MEEYIQKFDVINGIKFPYIVCGDEKWYPVKYIYTKIYKHNSFKIDNHRKSIKKFKINYEFLLGYKSIQETNCLNTTNMMEWINGVKCIDNDLDNLNCIREYFGLDKIEIINNGFDEFIDDIIKGIKTKERKVCASCKRSLPKINNFYSKDTRNNDNFCSICRECASKTGRFTHQDEYLQYVYYTYGLKIYKKVKNSKIEDIYLMYAKGEINKLPNKKIIDKHEQFNIIKYLIDNKAINKEQINIKDIKVKYFSNTKFNVTLKEIYDYAIPNWKDYYWEYPYSKYDLKDNDYKQAKIIIKNYIKKNNIVIDDIYDYKYSELFQKAHVSNIIHDNIDFLMYYYGKNKCYCYKFNHCNNYLFFKDKNNRILAFKQYIRELKINYNKIPLVISKYRMQKHSATLYNLLRKYYNCDIYSWANEVYPDKFKPEDFNLECVRGRFDSMEEQEIDNVLREYFKYDLIHNVSSDDYTVRILDKKRQPDWFIILDDKFWIVEYWGMYNKQANTVATKDYMDLYLKKVKMYENSIRYTYYNYLFLYPFDLYNNYKGVRDKIELMLKTNDRIVGLEK